MLAATSKQSGVVNYENNYPQYTPKKEDFQMYFKEGKQINQIIEIEGFKLRKRVIREKYKVRVIVLTMDYNYVDEITIMSESDVDTAEEVLMQSVYDYIRYETDELDKVMAYFTKG